MAKPIILTILLLCAQIWASPPLGTELIPPSAPNIRYTGRFDTRDPENTRFDWAGNTIELRFGGSSCAIKIRGDGGDYDISVNDSIFKTRFDTTVAVHRLAAGLDPSKTHSLRIFKRFDDLKDQIAEIKGFYIDAGQSLHPLAHSRPTYRIELIGGSNLLGFGAEADTIHCANPAAYSNASLSFGMVAARTLGAETHIAAMTGKGLVRNWNDPFTASLRPFGHHYTRTLKNDSTALWDFNSWTPHVAIVNFGTNDFSTYPHPPKESYIAQYRNFLDNMRARHPNVKIVCVTSTKEPARTYTEELVRREKKDGNKAIRFYSYKQVPQHLSGCDWHPGAEAHAKIGAELAEIIRPLLK